jgi:hypothetical protein
MKAVIVLVVLGVLLAIVAGFNFYQSEPMDDMRQRADALPLPKDFVLLSESYSPGEMEMFGSVPSLERVYHAPWPGLCDSLRDLGDHMDGPTNLAPIPRQYADSLCYCGALYGSGWRGWIRNYRHYQVTLTAWRPGFLKGHAWERPSGFLLLYPSYGPVTEARIVIPDGRARVVSS